MILAGGFYTMMAGENRFDVLDSMICGGIQAVASILATDYCYCDNDKY